MPRTNREASQKKNTLDHQTEYFTFLPHMEEGFHVGYHSSPGIVSDRNAQPREWLENMARYMMTEGRDVGFSIPDVLASEQQLRRLSRLPREEAISHQQMLDFRGVLAMLLLWDLWPKDETCPEISLVSVGGDATEFAASVTSALSPARAPDGLWAYVLSDKRSGEGKIHPLALISRTMGITPAADMGDLSVVLPRRVRWYLRDEKRFDDPCVWLSAEETAQLICRLRVLQAFNEQPKLQSFLYDREASLCVVLEQYISDLLGVREAWRATVKSGDQEAREELRLRVLAGWTLPDRFPVTRRELVPDEENLKHNPLLSVLHQGLYPEKTGDSFLFLDYQGVPFGVLSHEYLVEPARGPVEEEILGKLYREVALLRQNDPVWCKEAAAKLRLLREAVEDRTGLYPPIAGWLEEWARELEQSPVKGVRTARLTYPMTDAPVAVYTLMRDMIGLDSQEAVDQAFSDCLLLTETRENAEGLIPVQGAQKPLYGAAPLSPALCAWLSDQERIFNTEDLSLTMEPDGKTVKAVFALETHQPEQGDWSRVVFERSYQLESEARTGAALVAEALPTVVLWPDACLTGGLWKKYFVVTGEGPGLETRVYRAGKWTAGKAFRTRGESWKTAETEEYPRYVSLMAGSLSAGMLISTLEPKPLRLEPAAVIAIDFGSIATAVMLRQGEEILQAVLPGPMHRVMLGGRDKGDALASKCLIPVNALQHGSSSEIAFYSVMDLFGDCPQDWKSVLVDGHIRYADSLEEWLSMPSNELYYDLKWSEEDYSQYCLRLFLKQVMLQALLSARLAGSRSATWRVSMPNAMPLHRQEAFLEMVRGLAREMEAETGVPLTTNLPPVLYGTENQADGLYFRSRSEVNARKGYLNMDIGGSTADISLWLNNGTSASVESSLMLGCRQMLYESLTENHLDAFVNDFSGGDLQEATERFAGEFRAEGKTPRGKYKCMLLLDDFMASYAPQIRKAMEEARGQGRITYLESLLLFQFGFLFTLCSELLQRAWRDEAICTLLPDTLTLCIAGNGGQLFRIFSPEQRTRLVSLTLERLGADHPLQTLAPIQSRQPKQEVVLGLLSEDGALSPSIRSEDHWNGTFPDEKGSGDLLPSFLLGFYRAFPQAAQFLMPSVYTQKAGQAILSRSAMLEVEAVQANTPEHFEGDDLAGYVASMSALKRIWRI